MEHDPIDDTHQSVMTMATALARAAETLLRQQHQRAAVPMDGPVPAQQHQSQPVGDQTRMIQVPQHVLEHLAEQHYLGRLTTPGPSTHEAFAHEWGALALWAEVNPARFADLRQRWEDQLQGLVAPDTLLQVRTAHGSLDAIDQAARHLAADRAQQTADAVFGTATHHQDREATARAEQHSSPDHPGPSQDSDHAYREQQDAAGRASNEHAYGHHQQDLARALRETPTTPGSTSDDTTIPAYDTAERRARDEHAMIGAGVPAPAIQAKMVADHGNAHDPRQAAAAANRLRAPRTSSTPRPSARTPKRQQTLERDIR